MDASLLLIAVAWVAAASGQAPPTAGELLRRSLELERAYEGRVRVEAATPSGDLVQELAVAAAPGGLYRREVRRRGGKGGTLAVSDGRVEWVYDPALNRVWKGAPPEPDYKRLSPEEERALLEANYVAAVSPGQPVARRATWRLELRAKDGNLLRRRLWLDRAHGVVLRSESYRPDGTLASTMRFTSVRYGAVDAARFRFAPPPGAKVLERAEPDFMEQDEAEQAVGFVPRLPAWLPPGFVLESLDALPRGKRRILHARYSDGVTALSFFQCPRGLRLDLGRGKAQPARVGRWRGELSWAEEGVVLSWSSRGMRFALIADLPEAELLRAAESVR